MRSSDSLKMFSKDLQEMNDERREKTSRGVLIGRRNMTELSGAPVWFTYAAAMVAAYCIYEQIYFWFFRSAMHFPFPHNPHNQVSY